MDLIIGSIRKNLRGYNHNLLHFDKELNRIRDTIKSLVLGGESSSLLIVGRRGVGKKHLLKEAISRCRTNNKEIDEALSEVHLNGMCDLNFCIFLGIVHTDDRSAMKSLAKQLHRETLLDSIVDCSGDVDKNEMKCLPFSQQLNLFLQQVQSGDKTTHKALLIVLHEFDLFTLHRNQLLLYNLFDCCQSGATPICVIGLTCRLDVMELLEKRVKSRFSHRQIYLISPSAPIGNVTSYANNNPDDPTKSEPFERFCQICEQFLRVDYRQIGDGHLAQCELKNDDLQAWNDHVSDLMSDEIVIDSLRQAWSISVSVRRLINMLIPIVATLGGDKTRIDPVQFIDSLCLLRLDPKVNLLKEYVKFSRSNCPGYLYEKVVVLKALDNLINSELIISGKLALHTSSKSVPSSHRAGNMAVGIWTNSTMPNYRPLYCHVDINVLTSCLDAYPNCPVELDYWIHSKTF